MASTQQTDKQGTLDQPMPHGRFRLAIDVKLLQDMAAKHGVAAMQNFFVQSVHGQLDQLQLQIDALEGLPAAPVDDPSTQLSSPVVATAPTSLPHTLTTVDRLTLQLQEMQQRQANRFAKIQQVLFELQEELEKQTQELRALQAAVAVPSHAKHGVVGSTGVVNNTPQAFATYHTQLQNVYVIPLLARCVQFHHSSVRGLRKLETAVDAGQEIGKGFFIKCFASAFDWESEINEEDPVLCRGDSAVVWTPRMIAKQSSSSNTPASAPKSHDRSGHLEDDGGVLL